MKTVLKGLEPKELETYRNANPANEWEQFTNKKPRKQAIQDQLKLDQGGLCAYCEIKLLPKTLTDDADFRVEHFHPKSDTSTPHNWHLDWQNLLACCHGGSQRNVVDARHRFTSPDHSCDVPKGNKNLDAEILNPLTLPATWPLFTTERTTGKLKVNLGNCQAAGVSEVKAKATINELRLDSARLNRFRKKLLDDLNTKLRQEVASGKSVEHALNKLAQIHLRKDPNQHWPAFFTTIRSYLGQAAEERLRAIQYKG